MKEINGLESYLITKQGAIFSKITNKYLVPKIDKFGYLQITIKEKCYRVHRLVAKTYLHNYRNLDVVNHKNGIKIDNRLENLEWVSQKENVKHSWETGLSENIRLANSKIVLDTQNGVFYKSAKEASKYSNYAYSTIRSMLNGGLKNNTTLVYV